MIAPADARALMLAKAWAVQGVEQAPLSRALGRTLAESVAALRTQPPFASSAMDGYAVRAGDLAGLQALHLAGESAAGRPFGGELGPMQAIRIFTGAAIPKGADTILMQENAARTDDGKVRPLLQEKAGRHVRAAGLDFCEGDALLKAGLVLDPRHLGLAASMGHPALPVRPRPRVAVISTGDELVAAGHTLGPGQIASSNNHALAALIERAGGLAIDFGIAPDRLDATQALIDEAAGQADLIVTCGGASVGDHDFVQAALRSAGFEIDFWKVAIRPGKPLMLGAKGSLLCVGLPGNPVSSFVCALLFVDPLIRRMLGQDPAEIDRCEPAVLGAPLPANDHREDYMRCRLARVKEGAWEATPLPVQDSSMQSALAQADALLVRPPHAAAAAKGAPCRIIRL
jgi:molybdopterin molybdotransferase